MDNSLDLFIETYLISYLNRDIFPFINTFTEMLHCKYDLYKFDDLLKHFKNVYSCLKFVDYEYTEYTLQPIYF